MPWTQFWQQRTGGERHYLPFKSVFIEADEATARMLFMEAFGQHPDDEACGCCGRNWPVIEWDTLDEATALERNALVEQRRDGDPVLSMDDFMRDPHANFSGERHEVVLMFSDGKIVLPISR